VHHHLVIAYLVFDRLRDRFVMWAAEYIVIGFLLGLL